MEVRLRFAWKGSDRLAVQLILHLGCGETRSDDNWVTRPIGWRRRCASVSRLAHKLQPIASRARLFLSLPIPCKYLLAARLAICRRRPHLVFVLSILAAGLSQRDDRRCSTRKSGLVGLAGLVDENPLPYLDLCFEHAATGKRLSDYCRGREEV